jgi:dTDP-4-dehydrorhamnose 3,5-epimerase
MEAVKTPLGGLLILKPTRIFRDQRGFFHESYNQKVFKGLGITNNFVQDNHSMSYRGVLRGFHFQLGENAQCKLTRVVEGNVLDVVVDMRLDSPTFGQWYGVELSDKNMWQLYVPAGFAHAVCCMSDKAHLCYKVDKFHVSGAERGLCPIDPCVGVKWPFGEDKLIMSDKDRNQPSFETLVAELKGMS